MEHSLLSPHACRQTSGIPLMRALPLLKGSRYYDHNIRAGFGSDKRLEEINRLQTALGELTDQQLERRVAADFCCIWRYDYPRNVRRICEIIGGCSHTQLRLHYQVCPARRKEFIDYARALQGWCEDKAPDDTDFFNAADHTTINKVYTLLGSKDALKTKLAERTYWGLASRVMNCSFWGDNTRESAPDLAPFTVHPLPAGWQARMHNLESEIRQEMVSAARDFLCDVGGSGEPACHFKFTRRVDILVSSIGCLRWRGNLPPKDELISGRRQITRDIMSVLEHYWLDAQLPGDRPDIKELRDELFGLLGEKDDCKRWLVGSLWKNISVQTERHAYPMKRWVELVQIAENFLDRDL
jgi:hypothetical protein